MHYVRTFFVITFVVLASVSLSNQSEAASACTNLKNALRDAQKKGDENMIDAMRDGVRMNCGQSGREAHQRLYEAQRNADTNAEVGNAILSFGLGFLEGYAGGGGFSRQSAPAQTGRTTRSSTRTVNQGQRTFTSSRTTTVNAAPSVRTNTVAPVVRTSGSNTVVNSGGANVQLNGNKTGVIGTITQPSGVKDPIYSTPCRPRQTGATSFDCSR